MALEQRPKEGEETAVQKSAEGHPGRGNDKYQGVPPPQVGGCCCSAGGVGGCGVQSETKEGQVHSGGLWGPSRGLGFHGVSW